MANNGRSSENDDLGVEPGSLGDGLSAMLRVDTLGKAAGCLFSPIVSKVASSALSAGKTKFAGTSSPSLLLNLSIFAERSAASEGMSKVGIFGAPLAAEEIAFGLDRKESAAVSPAMASTQGEAGIVSKDGLTDAMADGGPCTVFDVSLSKGGGFRTGFRTCHASAELMHSV
jgi:hypothetical protein